LEFCEAIQAKKTTTAAAQQYSPKKKNRPRIEIIIPKNSGFNYCSQAAIPDQRNRLEHNEQIKLKRNIRDPVIETPVKRIPKECRVYKVMYKTTQCDVIATNKLSILIILTKRKSKLCVKDFNRSRWKDETYCKGVDGE
jgi:hypothetical protein